jgi:ribosomal protein S18 acetylase RimI-like enzyme
MTSGLLRRIDGYLDAAPRAAARVEDLGTLRLFVKTEAEGWPYYARPIPGADAATPEDVARVRARQRELRLPEAFEWVVQTAPSFATVAGDSGLAIVRHPLLALAAAELERIDAPPGSTVRIGHVDDDHALLAAVAMAGFDVPGTEVGAGSFDEVGRLRATVPAGNAAFQRRRVERGLTVPAVAEIDGRVVAVGFHQPVGTLSEIVGVATLPAFRRRGIAAALTSLLAADALAGGVDTVVLSANDDAVARVYERVGFRRVGEVGAAEPLA